MELHKNIKIDKEKYNFSLKDHYLDYFAKAMDFALSYYKDDFDRIANTKFEEITADFFLREMAWCICVSGFNAKIVSKIFPKLLDILNPIFIDISNNDEQLLDENFGLFSIALEQTFANKKKIKAILNNSIVVRDNIKNKGWVQYKNNELNTPQKLEKFDMIGPVISLHLARNSGLLDFVKPDLHLNRMAKNWNFKSPLDLCKEIQKRYDMPLGLIDLCLFYSASTFGTSK